MTIHDIIKNLPKHKTKRYASRPISDLKSIAIHHSATTSGTPAAFARYHIESNMWPGIGYAYVIDKQGRIYKCNPLSVITYHVGNSNREAIGICLVGNFDIEKPTEAQLNATVELVKELRAKYPGLTVKGHKEYPGYAWKSCPGRLFDMKDFRDRLQ